MGGDCCLAQEPQASPFTVAGAVAEGGIGNPAAGRDPAVARLEVARRDRHYGAPDVVHE